MLISTYCFVLVLCLQFSLQGTLTAFNKYKILTLIFCIGSWWFPHQRAVDQFYSFVLAITVKSFIFLNWVYHSYCEGWYFQLTSSNVSTTSIWVECFLRENDHLSYLQATHKNGMQLSFYTMPEYESWKHNLTGNASGWSIKYYKVCIVKFVTCEPITEPFILLSVFCLLHNDLFVFLGVGTSTSKEGREYFLQSWETQERFYLGRWTGWGGHWAGI